jgi:molecular chaperone Hsp33
VAFRCTCSRERIADTLHALGREEVEGIVHEHGLVEANCDFCGRRYAFDAVDVAQLFATGAGPTTHAPRQ